MILLLLLCGLASAVPPQSWSALRPWERANPPMKFVSGSPKDGTLNAQQQHMATTRSLMALLLTYTGDDLSQVPEDILNEIPVSALLELDESVVATLPPSQFLRMHQYADDHSYVFIQIIKMSTVNEIVRLPWADMQEALPGRLYNELSDAQLGAIPWEDFIADLPPDVMAGMDRRVLRSITPRAWSLTSAEQINALPPSSLAALPISSFSKIDQSILQAFPCETLLEFPSDKLEAIGGPPQDC